MRAVVGALLVVTALAAAAALWSFARRPGPVLYVGGPILTMDAGDRVVEALAVEGERIAAAGSAAELQGWADASGARVVDLEGRALLPGFVDAHSHFPAAGIFSLVADLQSPPSGDVASIEDLVGRLREQAVQTDDDDWVVGVGYDDTLLQEARHPNRSDLDRVSGRLPVVAFHVSGHLAALNSRGLEELGIDATTPDPEGGRLRRDPKTGEPNGVLEEEAARGLTELLTPSPLEGLRIVRHATELYLSAGVTTAQNGLTTEEPMWVLGWLVRLSLLPLRVVLWPGPELAEALDDGRVEFESPDPERLRLGAVKLMADGSIQGYTGYLERPYHVPLQGDPRYRGYPRFSREALFELVARHHASGRQLAVHANGDAAIDEVLAALEAAQREHPRPDARPVIVHAQMAREDQLERMRVLGAIPSFFGLHVLYWGDRHRAIFLGPERASRISPAASAARKGLRFTLHADSPVVPMQPLRIVSTAVNRRTRSGNVLGADQRIDPMRALRAITIDAAWQHFEEAEKGSLEPGKLADLVILDRSPLADPTTIDEIRVLETIVGGRSVWRAEES